MLKELIFMNINLDKKILDILACPACHGDVELKDGRIVCKECGKEYFIKDGKIPMMFTKDIKEDEKEYFTKDEKIPTIFTKDIKKGEIL